MSGSDRRNQLEPSEGTGSQTEHRPSTRAAYPLHSVVVPVPVMCPHGVLFPGEKCGECGKRNPKKAHS